jgi:1,4-dihydroxy-2-naphthoyl-CoA synthase
MSEIRYDVSDGVGTITLDRPHRKNAFTVDMVDAWAEIVRTARTDSQVARWSLPVPATRSAPAATSTSSVRWTNRRWRPNAC